MKLGILAPQESGKSSYLLALYGVLMHQKNPASIEKFPLRFTMSDSVRQRIFEDNFQRLLRKDLGDDRFPPRTTVLDKSILQISHKAKNKYYEIEFIDFPGEVLRGASTEEDLDFTQKVENNLAECDAFIVLLDANALLELEEDPFTANYRLATGKISTLLHRAVLKAKRHDLASSGVPVAFCVSKFDELGEIKENGSKQIDSAYQNVSETFFDFFKADHKHPVMISAVSLGQNIRNGGAFKPFQIDIPFDFCFSLCAYNALQLNRKVEARWEEYRRQTQSRVTERIGMGVIGSAFDRLNTGRSLSSYELELASDVRTRDAYKRKVNDFHELSLGAIKSISQSPTSTLNHPLIPVGQTSH